MRDIPLGTDLLVRLIFQAADWGVGELYLTGGEPFLLPDIAQIVTDCAAVLPTTLLTNGMLFRGRTPGAAGHAPHRFCAADQRGFGHAGHPRQPPRHGQLGQSGGRIRTAIAEGFRVRVAATVGTPTPDALGFLDTLGVPPADQIIRPIARQGAADTGVRLTPETLVPEVTVTADGIYWHPVATTDDRALVTRQIEPLGPVLDHVSRLFAEQWARANAAAASLFPCA